MPDLLVTAGAALGVLLGVVVLAWLSSTAVALGVGRPVALAATDPVLEALRLVRQRRRRTVEADRLLWRIGCWGLVPVAALLLALVPWGDTALLPSTLGVVWANTLDVVVWALV